MSAHALMMPNPALVRGAHSREHRENQGCAVNPPCRPVGSIVDFNDPDAWAFCQFCAFLVASDTETGDLLPHLRSRTVHTGVYVNFEYEECWGTHLAPTPLPDPPDGVFPLSKNDVYLGGE